MLGTESTFCLLEHWFPVLHREPLGTRGSSAQAAAIHSWCAISFFFFFLIYKRFKKQNKTKKWCSLETLPGRLGSPATVPHSTFPFLGDQEPPTCLLLSTILWAMGTAPAATGRWNNNNKKSDPAWNCWWPGPPLGEGHRQLLGGWRRNCRIPSARWMR